MGQAQTLVSSTIQPSDADTYIMLIYLLQAHRGNAGLILRIGIDWNRKRDRRDYD